MTRVENQGPSLDKGTSRVYYTAAHSTQHTAHSTTTVLSVSNYLTSDYLTIDNQTSTRRKKTTPAYNIVAYLV